MENYILELKDITKRFPGVVANKQVNISVKLGEIHGLVGENGAGKSTLLKILNGIYPQGTFEGKIFLDGSEVSFHSPYDAQLKGIGFVPQEINVLDDLSVSENIFVGRLNDKSNQKAFVLYSSLHRRAEKLLEENKISLNPRSIVKTLNVGQKQLLMIARALSKTPRVLILDEPTSSLTLDQVENLFTIMKHFRDRGTSIIFVTHKIGEIMRITDRVSVMCDGRHVSTLNRNEYDADRLIVDMIGRKIETLYPKRNTIPGEEVLRVENLSVPHPKIRDRYLIRNVNFSLRKGEVLGFAGLIGAGRSEVLNAIYGSFKRKSGDIYVNQKKVVINREVDAIKNGISIVTEDRKKDGLMFLQNVMKNMTISNLRTIASGVFIGRRKEIGRAEVLFKELKIKAPGVLTSVLSLSGGNQQKVVIGRALDTEPLIILLDEPTKGIDVGSKSEIYSIINALSERGVSIIMVSSELPELLAMCDRFVVMAGGTVSRVFSKEEASEVALMKAAVSY